MVAKSLVARDFLFASAACSIVLICDPGNVVPSEIFKRDFECGTQSDLVESKTFFDS
jgi:hypothetical protein